MRRQAGWVTASLLGAVAAAVPLLTGGAARSAPPAGNGEDRPYTLTFGGYPRTFRVHVPAGYGASAAGKRRFPVVVMLHGAGGDAEQAERQTGWGAKGEKEGFVAVFPDALPARPERPASFSLNPRFWDDGSGRAGARESVDDIGFLGAVLDDVEKRYVVDTQRIYLTGFSSGAAMTFRAAVSPQLSPRLAAAAPVAGQLFDRSAKPIRAVSVFFLMGTADPLNPMEGGRVKMPWGNTQVKPRVSDTVLAYARAIGAPESPAPIESKKAGVKVAAYGPGRDGSVLVFTSVEGMGHTWPGGRDFLPQSMVGARTNKLNATDAIWSFFSKHVLADRVLAP